MAELYKRLRVATATAAVWAAWDGVLYAGQIAVESDNLTTNPRFKIGDGVTVYSSLPFFSASAGAWGAITGTLSDQTDLQNALNAKQDELVGFISDGVSGSMTVPTLQFIGTSFTRSSTPAAGNNSLELATTAYVDRLAVQTEIRPTGDPTTTDGTPVIIPGMSAALAANSEYKVDAFLSHGCTGNGGVKFAINIPTGATMKITCHGRGAATPTTLYNTITASATLTTNALNTFVGDNGLAEFNGTISTGATAGDVEFYFAAGTATTQTAKIFRAGSGGTITKTSV